ncbi:MAG: hypothetical protein Q8P41_11650 [Pseudomonadota bacterium]|nr:hypothetical protein [Pseudomonadota bacterium]
MLLAFFSFAQAACPSRTTAADLASAVSAAEIAYVGMDLDAFRVAREQADAAIPCLVEILTPPDAAAWHRLAGLDAFVTQDTLRTLSAFRAAVSIQPAYKLPSTIAPEGNPLANVYAMAANQPMGAVAHLTTPAWTLAYVDGARAPARATQRQTLVQLATSDGEVLWSAVLLADAPAPDWSAFQREAETTAVVTASTSTALPTAAPKATKKKHKPTLPIAIAAGGAAAASGVLYGLAASSRAEFDDPSTSLDEVEGLAGTTNTLGYSAIGAGVVALGLGAVAIVTVAW